MKYSRLHVSNSLSCRKHYRNNYELEHILQWNTLVYMYQIRCLAGNIIEIITSWSILQWNTLVYMFRIRCLAGNTIEIITSWSLQWHTLVYMFQMHCVAGNTIEIITSWSIYYNEILSFTCSEFVVLQETLYKSLRVGAYITMKYSRLHVSNSLCCRKH